MKMKDVDVSVLPNYGILNIELDDEMMDYLWDLIIKTSPKAKWDGRKLLSMEDYNDKQWSIKDKDHVFAEKVLQPAAGIYFDNFGTPFKLKSTHEHQLAFSRFWCRAATRGDYQSLHNHQGIFTFVVWMRIPFDGKKENELQPGFRPEAGDFCLCYPDTCGQIQKRGWTLDSSWEGKMLFFPSDIDHIVYPHYTTDEFRISLAGDIALNSLEPIEGSFTNIG